MLDVANALGRQRLVALLHFAHGPAERVGGLLRIDDDRREEMRDVLVHPELEALGIDHDQPHVVRRRPIEDAGEHRVDADRLARTGRPGDEQMRHRRQVGDVGLAMNRLAERQRQLGRGSSVHLRFEQLAKRDLLAIAVRDLDADRRLTGNPIDQDRLGLHREAQIVGEPGDLRVFDASVGLELERGDDRARMYLDDGSLDRELAALLLEQPRAVHELPLVDLALGLRRIEERQRRQRVVPLPPFRRRLCLRLRIRQRRRGRRQVDLWWTHRRRRLGADRGRNHGRLGRVLAAPARARSGVGHRWRRHIGRAPRHGRGGRIDFGNQHTFFGVLRDDLAPLSIAPSLVAPDAEGVDAPETARLAKGEHDREKAAERELCRNDDRQEAEGDDDDERSRAVQVLGQLTRDELPGVAARSERLAPETHSADDQAQECRDAGQQKGGADDLGSGGVDRTAPEVVPSGHDQEQWDGVGAVAGELKGELGGERTDPSREVGRRARHACAEEPDRIARLVARQRDDPQERGRKERHADEFTEPARKGGSLHDQISMTTGSTKGRRPDRRRKKRRSSTRSISLITP